MPASISRIRISEAQIKRFTLKGGSVHGATRRLSERTEALAVFYAPKRTGRMAASIRFGENWSNGRQARFVVTVGARYATYVLKGTVGPIYPKHRARYRKGNLAGKRPGSFSGRIPRLPVGKSQGEPMSSWSMAPSVAGQDANNFLSRALRRAMQLQGYL